MCKLTTDIDFIGEFGIGGGNLPQTCLVDM